jgi:flagellar protein FliS
MDKRVSEQYLMQQLMSASPAKLVAMLYDRAVSLLNETIDAIDKKDVHRRWRANKKATEVICHLWETLDMERGGDVAANLNQLYGFMLKRLTAVDIDNNAEAAREVIKLLEPLRKSWHEMADAAGKEADANRCATVTTKITMSA